MPGNTDPRKDSSERLVAAARTLAVDALCAEVVDALTVAGVRSILLKGPALADWLYRDGELREYDDCDLLVAPEEAARAAIVLARLGFRPFLDRADAYTSAMAPPHAECWVRGERWQDVVDLHDCVYGVHAQKDAVWRKLSTGTEPMVVGGVPVEVLDLERRAALVVLHAAANGSRGERSLEDLRRALAVADDDLWRRAARMAARIGGRDAFAAGLRLLPAGRELASRLGIQPPMSPEVRLHAYSVPDGAMFLQRLFEAEGAGNRARLLGRGLVPPRDYMRARSALARRGPAGLGAAYALRVLTRVATAGSALRALRSAHRGGR